MIFDQAHVSRAAIVYDGRVGQVPFNEAYATVQGHVVQFNDAMHGEPGEDNATAVNWTLRQAPSVIKDDSQRLDFAENGVQPLQRCYESMKPSNCRP